ncbi:DISARM system phospholipase D-like protein DrmC [Luteolibacter arcticus]|uniref:DISARM system phospholipase D-like protein DrmC n=1 Tax=Luteolibacter arcticus TaxID=1581411 RepID=A0ABT3GL69_9BACT|nr:DISARM system phospholipase D-like protein DrmC [Luteolibacter arcticus]MCW1924256.1 DISARM system phospholipase D-like protein DrmC [Luteolibacter arcticus]
MNPFIDLSPTQLQNLHAAFQHGSLKYGVTTEGLIQQGLSTAQSTRIDQFLKERDFPAAAVAAIIEAVSQTRANSTILALAQTLVITGPAIPGEQILSTGSRFIEIVQHAKRELMLATFALYQGDQILAPIHEAMERNHGLEVTLILNIPRRYGDTTLSEEIIASFRNEFFGKHWPWPERPKVYFSPASLHLTVAERSSMHGKFLIADEERCFITSANFTEAAQRRNIEVGVELSGSLEPTKLSGYFKSLIREGKLTRLA